MFKKRGGLAFKPKISRRPQPASIATSQQSNSADKPKEASLPEVAAPAEVPSLPQATPEPNASNTAAPPEPSPPLPPTTSEQEAQNVSPARDDPLPHPETTEQPAQDVTVTDESPAGTASRLDESPSQPLGPTQPEATPPEPFVDQEATVAPAAPAESEPSEQSSAPSPEVVDTRDDSTVPDATPSTLDPVPPKQRKRVTQSATPKNKAAKSTSSEPSQTEPKKRQRKPKRTQADGEEQQDGGEVPEGAPKKRQRKSKEGTQAKPRRARSLTPEDAETQLVDHQKLTMADLTRDLHIGKKFSRHDELRERERLARAKAKADKSGEGDGDDGDTEADGSNLESSSTENARPTAPSTPGDSQQQQQGSGVQFRIVDGQIVLDQSSLVMDRHARAAAAQRDMETIEENDFTRLITSSSYMSSSKLRGPNVWTAEETVLFYRGLEMFGTDFEIIAQMFPGKQRRQVKLKFNREERHNPKLVDAALIGVKKTRMNMDEYKALTGGEFESVESIEAQHREQEEHFEARQKQLADEQAEIMRKKREELFADDDGGGGGGVDGGEGSKKKKGKGKRRGADSAALGDPEIVMDM